VHVSDVVAGIEIAINLLLDGGALERDFQLSSESQYSLREIVEIIQSIANQELSVIWGARPYRRNEVMQVPKIYSSLPGWSQKKSLKTGLAELLVDQGVK
jgi:nucleoside-diphosphate-sugar epimerase